jgi:hypothetical protein
MQNATTHIGGVPMLEHSSSRPICTMLAASRRVMARSNKALRWSVLVKPDFRLTSSPPKLLAIFPETVVRVGPRIIPVKPIGVTGGIEVFTPWMVALPDFVKRIDEIQSPHRFVNHLASQPYCMLQSHQ